MGEGREVRAHGDRLNKYFAVGVFTPPLTTGLRPFGFPELGTQD